MPRKTKKQQTLINIGIDIGYGHVKAVTDDQEIVFPSVYGYARELTFQESEITAKYPGDRVFYNGNDYFIGKLAQSQLAQMAQIKLRGRAGDDTNEFEFRALMAIAAIGKLFSGDVSGDVIHIRLATGLPVRHMRDAAKFKESLIGQFHVQTDNANFIANVTECPVMPQPYGTLYSNTLKKNGEDDECYTYLKTGIVDVGTYTVDLALDDTGEFIIDRSNSGEGGVHSVHERIAEFVDANYRYQMPLRDVEHAMRSNCIKYQGKLINIGDELQSIYDPFRHETLNLMQNTWQQAADIDAIFITGGGAGIVFDAIKAEYDQAVLVDNSQFANAHGYLRYANSLDLD